MKEDHEIICVLKRLYHAGEYSYTLHYDPIKNLKFVSQVTN